jgi:hypothetical protein
MLAVPGKDRGKCLKEQADQNVTGAAMNSLKTADTPEALVAALPARHSPLVAFNAVCSNPGESKSLAAPTGNRAGREASRRRGVACGSSRLDHSSTESNASATSTAGRRPRGASHPRGETASGSSVPAADNTAARRCCAPLSHRNQHDKNCAEPDPEFHTDPSPLRRNAYLG